MRPLASCVSRGSALTVHRDEIDIQGVESGGTLVVRTETLCALGQRSVLLVRDDDTILGELDVVVFRKSDGVAVLRIESPREDLALLRSHMTTLCSLDAPFSELRDAAAELESLARQRLAIVPVRVAVRARTEVIVRLQGPDGRLFASFPALVRYCISRDGGRFAAISVSASQSAELSSLASELRCEDAHERAP